MQHKPTLEVMQRGIRAEICPDCHLRPPGSETMRPSQPRSCEPQCTIFGNLHKLQQIADQYDDPTISSYQRAMNELICTECDANPTSGDYCSDRTTQYCPLARYAGSVVSVLQRVIATHNSTS